jgi:CheY-like chemotaxis protein
MQDSIQIQFPEPLVTQRVQRTLLQIEDNHANALLVEELIARRSDLKLFTATCGYQGIDMALLRRPEVILMDINMPDIGGFAALKLLRNNSATCHIPVIALSSSAYLPQIREGREAGFFQYLTKPLKLFELMDEIDAALRFAAANKPRISTGLQAANCIGSSRSYSFLTTS